MQGSIIDTNHTGHLTLRKTLLQKILESLLYANLWIHLSAEGGGKSLDAFRAVGRKRSLMDYRFPYSMTSMRVRTTQSL
jgi:hypothetical protein